MIKADCDIAEPPLNPGNSAFVRQGSAEHNAPFANERRPRPTEDRNREDLQFRPQDAAENQVEDGHRAQGVVAPLRPSAIIRFIINTPLEEPVNLSYDEVEFVRHYVVSEAYCQIIRTHRSAVSKIIKLALRRKQQCIFVNKNRVETIDVN